MGCGASTHLQPVEDIDIMAPENVRMSGTPAKSLDTVQKFHPAPANELEETVNAVASALDDIRGAMDSGPGFRRKVAEILDKREAPMLLLDAEDLRAHGRLPRYDEVEAKLKSYGDVGDDDCVVFISHRWWRPESPDGDHNEKVQILLGKLPELRKVRGLSEDARVYVWWDFYSIRQTEAHIHKVDKGAQILSIPIYLAAADTAVAFKAGDEDAYTSGGDASHKGFYENRVWTMVELYGFSSNYALDVSAATSKGRYLMEVVLGYCDKEKKLKEEASRPDQLETIRGQLHDSLTWSLPPTANLTDIKDLKFIEPMLIALTAERKHRMHAACRFGFAHAAAAFTDDAKDNLPDAKGFTPLMICAVKPERAEIIATLLAGGADPNVRHPKLRTTALHQAIAYGHFEYAAMLLEAGADPSLTDSNGRNPLMSLAVTELNLKEDAPALEQAPTSPDSGAECVALEGDDAVQQAAEKKAENEAKRAKVVALVGCMIEKGVDPCARDVSGRTALDLATQKSNDAVATEVSTRMTVAQHAACPPTLLAPNYTPKPVVATASREQGIWYPRHKLGEWPYTKFTPKDSSAKGPTIMLEPHLGDMEAEAELYVKQFNATVYSMARLQVQRYDFKDTTFGDIAVDWCDFASEVCGTVDCVVTFCMPGEIALRGAAARPDLVKSVIASAVATDDPNPGGMVQFVQGLVFMGGEAVAGMMMQMMFPEAYQTSTEAPKALQKLSGLCQQMEGSYKERHAKGTELKDLNMGGIEKAPWGHYNTIQQPVLCLAGTDDAAFLAGIENLSVTVPNAEIEYFHGCQHMLQAEAPDKYRALCCGFIEKTCMPAFRAAPGSPLPADMPVSPTISNLTSSIQAVA